MAITRKVLVSVAATAVGLFIVANPLGDAHHGLGKHHKVVADIGQVVWVAFLIAAAALVVLIVVALAQRLWRSRDARSL